MKRRILLFSLLVLLGAPARLLHAQGGASAGGRGGGDIKATLILAKTVARTLAADPACVERFGRETCRAIRDKLTLSALSWWPAPDPLHPEAEPAYSELICRGTSGIGPVTACTTSDPASPIWVDYRRAERNGLLLDSAIVLMFHEGGRAATVSLDERADALISEILVRSLGNGETLFGRLTDSSPRMGSPGIASSNLSSEAGVLESGSVPLTVPVPGQQPYLEIRGCIAGYRDLARPGLRLRKPPISRAEAERVVALLEWTSNPFHAFKSGPFAGLARKYADRDLSFQQISNLVFRGHNSEVFCPLDPSGRRTYLTAPAILDWVENQLRLAWAAPQARDPLPSGRRKARVLLQGHDRYTVLDSREPRSIEEIDGLLIKGQDDIVFNRTPGKKIFFQCGSDAPGGCPDPVIEQEQVDRDRPYCEANAMLAWAADMRNLLDLTQMPPKLAPGLLILIARSTITAHVLALEIDRDEGLPSVPLGDLHCFGRADAPPSLDDLRAALGSDRLEWIHFNGGE